MTDIRPTQGDSVTMSFLKDFVPSITEEMAETSELTFKAYLCFESSVRRTVVDLLHRELLRHGVRDERVFSDEQLKRRGRVDETQKSLETGLLESEFLIVFLTPDFLKTKWTLWELRRFLDIMEKDKRRKLVPIFYRLSVSDCGHIVEQVESVNLKERLGSDCCNEELRITLKKVMKYVGIDAEGHRMSDTEVVKRIMADVFFERRNVTVFLSHASEDRWNFVGLLKKEIEVRDSRIRCYLDETGPPIGGNISSELRNAIDESKIGVFVLSPEFVAKKWTMWELQRFLWRREEAKLAADVRPVLCPIFYRLSLEECKDDELYSHDEYVTVFARHGFFSEKRQRNLSSEKAMDLLRRISRYPGSNYTSNTFLHKFAEDVANDIITLASHLPEAQQC